MNNYVWKLLTTWRQELDETTGVDLIIHRSFLWEGDPWCDSWHVVGFVNCSLSFITSSRCKSSAPDFVDDHLLFQRTDGSSLLLYSHQGISCAHGVELLSYLLPAEGYVELGDSWWCWIGSWGKILRRNLVAKLPLEIWILLTRNSEPRSEKNTDIRWATKVWYWCLFYPWNCPPEYLLGDPVAVVYIIPRIPGSLLVPYPNWQ